MRKIIVITGPTAVGKTEYAIKIASNLGGEIVSCDSMQLYKYMDIGSAKPTVEERNQVRHYRTRGRRWLMVRMSRSRLAGQSR